MVLCGRCKRCHSSVAMVRRCYGLAPARRATGTSPGADAREALRQLSVLTLHRTSAPE
jgi:hypothetical protein